MNKAEGQALQEKYEEAALGLAAYRIIQDEYTAVRESMIAEEDEQLQQHAYQTMERMLRYIRIISQRVYFRRHVKRQGIHLLKFVGVIVLTMYLSFTVAVAASSQVRVRVMQLLLQITPSYIHLGFAPNGVEVDVPEDWIESYFPAYVPEGFYIKQYSPYEGASAIAYENGEGMRIDIDISGIHSTTLVDCENAEISTVRVNGISATMLQKDGWFHVIWGVGDRYLLVRTNIDRETTLQIAESIFLIEK